jgi:hypothetical protein
LFDIEEIVGGILQREQLKRACLVTEKKLFRMKLEEAGYDYQQQEKVNEEHEYWRMREQQIKQEQEREERKKKRERQSLGRPKERRKCRKLLKTN